MTDACRSFGLLVALVIGMTTVFAVAVTRVAAKGEQAGEQFAVSYTHLTLPTSDLV